MNGYDFIKITMDKMIKKYNLKLSEEEYIDLLESSMYEYCGKFNYCYIRQYFYLGEVGKAIKEVTKKTADGGHKIGSAFKSIFKRANQI